MGIHMEPLGKLERLSFRAPAELVRKFDTLSRKEGHTRSSFVRKAMKMMFADLQRDEKLIDEIRKMPYVFRYADEKNMRQYTITLRDDDYYLFQRIQYFTATYDISISQLIRASMVYMLKRYDLIR